MKVVLFCGGFGMRLRGYSESVPKPLVEIGDQPILLHIMQYYAAFGHTDFVLCLGWKAEAIKSFFLTHADVETSGQDLESISECRFRGWNIRFEFTGINACIGERLKQLEPLLREESYFYANYADGLCNVDLNSLTHLHLKSDAAATFVSVHPTQSFHTVISNGNGDVVSVESISDQDVWMNGGYFVLSGDFFEFIDAGEELVDEPFQRLIDRGRLKTHMHNDFWSCMDTYKEMQMLEEMHRKGETPWKIWQSEFPSVFDLSSTSETASPTNPIL